MVKVDPKRNYYADLDLPPSATTEEIKKQFRKFARQFHPDRNPGKESEFVPKFQAIQAAHEILSDGDLRQKYDDDRRKLGYSNRPPRPAFASAYSATRTPRTANPYTAPPPAQAHFPQPQARRPAPQQTPPQFPPRPAAARPPPTAQRTHSHYQPPPPPPNPPAANHQHQHTNRPSGASRFTGFQPPPKPYTQEDVDVKNVSSFWKNMGHASARKAPSPAQPERDHGPFGKASTASPGLSRSNTTRSPRRAGFDPSMPGGLWEPPASRSTYYNNVRHSIPNEDDPQPTAFKAASTEQLPQTKEPPKRHSHDNLSTQAMDDEPIIGLRQSAPYNSTGGEKTRLNAHDFLRRSASTRDATRLGARFEVPDTSTSPSSSGTTPDAKAHQKDSQAQPTSQKKPNTFQFATSESDGSASDVPGASARPKATPSRKWSKTASRPQVHPQTADAGGVPNGIFGQPPNAEFKPTYDSKLSFHFEFQQDRQASESSSRQPSSPMAEVYSRDPNHILHSYRPTIDTSSLPKVDGAQSNHKGYSPSQPWSHVWPFGDTKQSGVPKNIPSWAIPSSILPTTAKSETKQTFNPIKFNRFNVTPIIPTTQPTVDTEFSSKPWSGNFEAQDTFKPPPATAKSRSRMSPSRNTPTANSANLPDPFAKIFSTEPTTEQAPKSATSPIKFSADEWEKTFKEPSFVIPDPVSLGNQTSRPASTTARKPNRPRALSKGDEKSNSRGEVPRLVPDIDDAMDIDSEIPTPPKSNGSSEASNVRNVPSAPQRTEWREIFDPKPPPSLPPQSKTAPPTIIPPPPPGPPPKTPSQPQPPSSLNMGSMTSNLDTHPSTGLSSMTPITFALPNQSRPSPRHPTAPSPSPLKHFKPPIPPAVPSYRPSLQIWKQYLSTISVYMGQWYKFEEQFTNHFAARHADNAKFGTGAPNIQATVLLEASGDVKSGGVERYAEGLAQDQKLLETWSQAMGGHQRCMEQFVAVKRSIAEHGYANPRGS